MNGTDKPRDSCIRAKANQVLSSRFPVLRNENARRELGFRVCDGSRSPKKVDCVVQGEAMASIALSLETVVLRTLAVMHPL